MSAKLILECARQFLIDYGWTQAAYARSKTNKPVAILDNEATCFCSLGAIGRAGIMLKSSMDDIDKAIYSLSYLTFRGSVFKFNDEQDNVEQVIAKFDETIAKL